MNPSQAFRLQGAVFSALAWMLALVTTVMPRVDPRIEIVVIVILILFLGVPHGALDTIFARRLYQIKSISEWMIFGLAYVLLAAGVVGLWWLLPKVFLTGFLLVSAFHFSGDPASDTPWLLRFWYGGAVIALPALIHEREVAVLFGYLVPGDFGTQSAAILHWAALPWLIGLCITVLWELRRNQMTSLEVISLALLAAVATPLIGFTLYFCTMHSARHAIRTQKFAGEVNFLQLLKQAFIPQALIVLITISLLPLFRNLPFDAALVQLLFVGLAALTIPHMWLVERLRFSRELIDVP